MTATATDHGPRTTDHQDDFRPALAIAKIVPGPNPRKHFDEMALAELAESIRAKGVLEPILVRPLSRTSSGAIIAGDRKKTLESFPGLAAKECYELVAGERRLKAAQRAELKTIPALVRELSDQEAAEIRLVENEQRQDLSPLEKAAGYQDLIDRYGHTVESIGQKVGKSASTVRGFLKLLLLPEKAKKAVEDGTLPAATAGLIARLPSEKIRQEAAKDVMSYARGSHGVPSYRRVKEDIERRLLVELKQAPFDQRQEGLAGVGACTSCPKRAGNNRAEFPDARADMCTDPECYDKKKQAMNQILVQGAKSEGKTVLAPNVAKKLFLDYGRIELRSDAPYVDLAESEWVGDKRKTWKQRLGDKCEADVVIAFDPKGNLHRLVPKDKALKAVGSKANGSGSRAAFTISKQEKRKRDQAKLDREVAHLLQGDLVQKAESVFGSISSPSHNDRRVRALRLLVERLVEHSWSDAAQRVAERRGLECKKQHGFADWRATMIETISTADGPALLALLSELVFCSDLQMANQWRTTSWNRVDPLLEVFGVDRRAVEKDVREAKARSEKKKKKPVPAWVEKPPRSLAAGKSSG